MKKSILLGFVFMLIAFSCKKKQAALPPEPQIYYESALPANINVFDTSAKTTIQFSFQDGDGDIGTDQSGTKLSIFLRDSRDTGTETSTYQFPFPYIPSNIRTGNALTGNVNLDLGFQYYRIWDSLHFALKRDTMVWSVYVMDDAGHKSNTINTDTIFIKYGL